MLQAQLARRSSHPRRAVCAQNGIAVNAGFERALRQGLGDCLQEKVRRRPPPVCPDLANSYTQIGVNHLGSKSDENETKSL